MHKLTLPLFPMPHIPIKDHPGAFGAKRKFDIHTGVDLYASHGCPVYAIEFGVVKKIDWFTGEKINMPWWNNTKAICIQGESGVFCYGEVQEVEGLKVGDHVQRGQVIGYVLTVLKEMKGRPMSMLHLELYEYGYNGPWAEWKLNSDKPQHLKNPTSLILHAPQITSCSYDPYTKDYL